MHLPHSLCHFCLEALLNVILSAVAMYYSTCLKPRKVSSRVSWLIFNLSSDNSKLARPPWLFQPSILFFGKHIHTQKVANFTLKGYKAIRKDNYMQNNTHQTITKPQESLFNPSFRNSKQAGPPWLFHNLINFFFFFFQIYTHRLAISFHVQTHTHKMLIIWL